MCDNASKKRDLMSKKNFYMKSAPKFDNIEKSALCTMRNLFFNITYNVRFTLLVFCKYLIACLISHPIVSLLKIKLLFLMTNFPFCRKIRDVQ